MWRNIEVVLSESLERIWSALLATLPGVLAMLVVVAVTLGVAGAVRWFLRRTLARMGFDRRAHAWGITAGKDWDPGHAPSVLFARGAWWLLVLLGVALALDVFGASTTSALGLALLAFLPRLVVAGLVFIVGMGASRFLERSVLIGAVNMQVKEARLLSLGVKWVVLVLASAIALQHLGVGGALVTIAFSIVLGGIVLALALAVGLGSREVVGRAIEKRLQERDRPAEPEERAIHHL
jgi:hypothetical protein